MKRRDLFEIWGVLESLRTVKTNIRTAFTIAKNRNILQPEVDAIKEAVKPDEEMKQFETRRIQLCEVYAQKDELGNCLTQNGNFVFSNEDRIELEEKLKELRLNMPEADRKIKENDESLRNLLEDNVEINLIPFYLEKLPDDLISVQQLEILDKHNLIISEETKSE